MIGRGRITRIRYKNMLTCFTFTLMKERRDYNKNIISIPNLSHKSTAQSSFRKVDLGYIATSQIESSKKNTIGMDGLFTCMMTL